MISHIKHWLAKRKQAKHEATQTRSPHWPALERQFREKNPRCACCYGVDSIQVHHKRPFHLRPELELDPENLISLCMAKDKHCHLAVGHGGDFKAYNPYVASYSENVMAGRWPLEKAARLAKSWRQYR